VAPYSGQSPLWRFVTLQGGWMNVELSDRDKDRDKQETRERIIESRHNKEYERCMTQRGNSEGPGERECKRKKNDGEI
jgi:hypothetical protein